MCGQPNQVRGPGRRRRRRVPPGPAFLAGQEGGETGQVGVGDRGGAHRPQYPRWPAGGPAIAADVAEQGRRADPDGEVGCLAVVQADGDRRAGLYVPGHQA